jgi:hypothetical protein
MKELKSKIYSILSCIFIVATIISLNYGILDKDGHYLFLIPAILLLFPIIFSKPLRKTRV